MQAGSGFSPNYSNTGAWSNYTAFGIGIDLPRKLLRPDFMAAATGGAGYFWFGNQSAALGGFPLPAYLNWNVGVTFSQKNLHFDLRYDDTNLSKEQCFVLTGDLNGGLGGRIDAVTPGRPYVELVQCDLCWQILVRTELAKIAGSCADGPSTTTDESALLLSRVTSR